ncbi:MAG TPA: gliding motility-associated protein GldE [Paludibacteraceae bacterium]|nr:gliding motility-associated protein GldE [Paludibacteraceae bacterium]
MDTYLLLNAVTVLPFTFEHVITLLIIALLLGASAFMSASEVGFFSLTPHHRNEMESSNDEADRGVLKLLEQPEYLLATILISNNFVNVAIVILSAFFIDSLFDFSQIPMLKFVIQTGVITFLLLLFGEIMPKVYATQNPLKMTRKAYKTFGLLNKILKPFSKILVNSTHVVNKRLAKRRHNNLSIDELSEALELTTDANNEEKEILKGIVNFGNTTVDGVMTSRLDMVTVDLKTPYSEVLNTVIELGYSRIPVLQDSQDNIRGILYIKDLLPHLTKTNSFKWQSLIRPAFFVPETKKIDDLLRDFQKNKIHVAIVVDEFGGTLGMITMEDILEEVVGDISDEYDEDETLYTKIDDTTYLFEAKIQLNDFFKVTHIESDIFEDKTDEVDTLAGLLLELKGDIPSLSEQITFGDYTFEILAVDNRRIQKVKLYITSETKTDEA